MAKETPLVILCLQFCLIALCLGNESVDVESINKKVLELEIEILNLKNEVRERNQEVQELTRLTKMPNVAFRSILRENLGQVSTGQIIRFDQVGLNIGNAYNQHNGIFTAPYDGTYIFSMTLGNPGGKPGAFFMVQSDGSKREVIEFGFGGHTQGWDMGGITTVAELNAGNSIWIEGEGHISGAAPTDRYHTGFSGALLHKLVDEYKFKIKKHH